LKWYDVAVIGGGPVGSYAAYKLVGMGYGVVILEARDKLGEKSGCTGLVGQECADLFHIDESVILRRVNSARPFSPSGKLIRVCRPEPQACVLDRAAFDISLADRARSAGAEYILGGRVVDVAISDSEVRLKAVRHGEKLDSAARAIVMATGFGSKLVEGLGLGKVGDFVMGAQVEVETVGVNEVEVYFGREIAPGFFAWLVPTSANRARVGLLSRRSPGDYLKKLLASLQAQGKIVATEPKLSYGVIPLKPLSRTCEERLVVVGDAAGQVKPTTGGGIYYGLLCADIAADSLHRALGNGDLTAKGLAGYERAWRKKLARELKRGYWARKFYERLSDRQVNRLFDIIISTGLDEALLEEEDLAFDWPAEAVLKLLAHQAISRAVGKIKIPFQTGTN